jgi:hypothetical protein
MKSGDTHSPVHSTLAVKTFIQSKAHAFCVHIFKRHCIIFKDRNSKNYAKYCVDCMTTTLNVFIRQFSLYIYIHSQKFSRLL